MKKRKWFCMSKNNALFLVILFLTTTVSCIAASKKKVKAKKCEKTEFNDSVFRQAVGDSIYSILKEGKVVSILDTNNGLKEQQPLILSYEDAQVLRFLICDSEMVLGDVPNFGVVKPHVKFLFEKSKEEQIQIGVDFGLRTWILADRNGNILKTYSLAKYELLRFCHYLYPNDTFIANIYKSTKK